jgi:DNA-binding NarL/FixJ family response regulator
MTSSRITIVLAEGEQLIRCGIRCLLEMEAGFEVIGEAEEGLEVARLVARLKPRILVVPVAMPGLNGLEIARQVRQQSPETAVIILSRYSNEQYVIQALRNGVLGYVLKYAKPAELVRAIRRVVAGRRYLSEPLSEHPLETWLARAQDSVLDAYETLTDREREVLQLVAEGHKSTVIASRLSISPRTVEAHRASVMRKMGFSTLVDVILFAIARGILVRPVEPLFSSPTPRPIVAGP